MKNILGKIYSVRYREKDEQTKKKIWEVLVADFLQQFVRPSDTVLDIAAGHCEFINSIICHKKFAVDIDRRIRSFATRDVQVHICSATKLPGAFTGKIDVVFMGCFLEHLPSKDAIITVLRNVRRVLKPRGTLMILNPNIRLSTKDYWDYFDHLTPVSDRSVVEILQALGFTIELCIPGFVPNTIRDHFPKSPLLVRLYLHLPFLFPLFGKQMFIVARI